MQTATSDLSRTLQGRVERRELELPPMPGTAAQVLELCQQEDTDAARLSSVIHSDQAIATNVLRVANSAAYVGQIPCASLQQAISRLGLQLVTEIAMAVSVKSRLFEHEGVAQLMQQLWRHSVLTGFFTKEVARARRRNVETAFLCGLLHDVGKAVLATAVDAAADGEAVPQDVLLSALHEQHVAAGDMLAEEWGLPPQVREAIACHHEPANAENFADMAMMVRLGDLLAHVVLPAAVGEQVDEQQLRADEVVVGLNLYSDQVDALLGMKERALEVMEGMQ